MRFGVHNCVGARLAKGRQRLQGLDFAEVSEAPIYYYSPPRRDEYFTIHLDNPRLSIELDEYVEDRNADYRFIQFIGVPDNTRQEVVKHIPNMPNLAGQGTPETSPTPLSSTSWDSKDVEPLSDELDEEACRTAPPDNTSDGASVQELSLIHI